jgi:hypothetical protein
MVSFWLDPTVTDWYIDGQVADYINMLGKGQPGQYEWVFTLGSEHSINKPSEIAFYAHNLDGGLGLGGGVYRHYNTGDRIYVVGYLDSSKVYLRVFYPNGYDYEDEEPWTSINTPQNGAAPLVIGGTWSPNQWYKGNIDEVKLSNAVRSYAWIKASYHSEKDDLLYYGEGGGAFQRVYESFTNDTGNISFGGAQWRGQTFTPATTHTLQSVKLKLLRTAGSGVGNLNVAIKATDSNGLPTGANLSTGSMLCANIGANDYAVYSITMTDVVVNSGTKYAIIFSAPNMSEGNMSYRVNDPSNSSDYAGGNMLDSSNSGLNWSSAPTYRGYFEEWGVSYQLRH